MLSLYVAAGNENSGRRFSGDLVGLPASCQPTRRASSGTAWVAFSGVGCPRFRGGREGDKTKGGGGPSAQCTSPPEFNVRVTCLWPDRHQITANFQALHQRKIFARQNNSNVTSSIATLFSSKSNHHNAFCIVLVSKVNLRAFDL